MLDILQAIERIDAVVSNITLVEFEADWQRQWLVERGIQIISEASRHLTQEMKSQFPQIPWRKVADIGNVLRHETTGTWPLQFFGSWRKTISQFWSKSVAEHWRQCRIDGGGAARLA